MPKRKETELTSLVPAGLKPPSAPEIEMSVLGAMMIEKEAVPKVIEMLTPGVFYLKAHKIIYEAMIKLFNANEPIDTVSLFEELKKQNKLEDAGGAVYLSKLTENVSSAANVEYHAKILIEKAILTKLISISHEIAKTAYEGSEDAFEILDNAERKIFEIMGEHMKRAFIDMGKAVRDALEYIDAIHSMEYKKFAVPTGFYDLDEVLGGFQKSDLIILAARPSMGKTALGMAFAKNAAVLSKVPVAVFSLEMATIQLVIRLISSEGKIDAHKLRTGRMPKEEGSKLWRVASKLIEAPVFIDDAPAQTILEIRAKARRLKSEKKIGLIIIDYLQLIQGSSRTESREREISTISRSLKALAKELEIPVIALAQLNRAVEGRQDKRPQLSDLRESGSIEQDADVVMFINRPEYYGMKTDADGNSTEGMAEVIIAKQRNGPTGEVKLTFVKEFARFESREHFRRTEDVSVSQIEHEDVI